MQEAIRQRLCCAGPLADEPFQAPPLYSVYEGRKHPWVEIVGDGIDHYD